MLNVAPFRGTLRVRVSPKAPGEYRLVDGTLTNQKKGELRGTVFTVFAKAISNRKPEPEDGLLE